MSCTHGLEGGCADCASARRDRFAAAALEGLCHVYSDAHDAEKIAAMAVARADALIAELDKPRAGT